MIYKQLLKVCPTNIFSDKFFSDKLFSIKLSAKSYLLKKKPRSDYASFKVYICVFQKSNYAAFRALVEMSCQIFVSVCISRQKNVLHFSIFPQKLGQNKIY